MHVGNKLPDPFAPSLSEQGKQKLSAGSRVDLHVLDRPARKVHNWVLVEVIHACLGRLIDVFNLRTESLESDRL